MAEVIVGIHGSPVEINLCLTCPLAECQQGAPECPLVIHQFLAPRLVPARGDRLRIDEPFKAKIRTLRGQGLSMRAIGQRVGCGESTVHRVLRGER